MGNMVTKNLSTNEKSILKRAQIRLTQLKSDLISGATEHFQSGQEYASKSGQAIDSINSLLDRLEASIISNVSLRSSTDPFILQLGQIVNLRGDTQEISFERLIFKQLPINLFDSRKYFKNFDVKGRYNYWVMYESKNLIEIDNAYLSKY